MSSDAEIPDADAQEQAQDWEDPTESADEALAPSTGDDPEVNEADALEQAQEVPLDDERA